MKELSNVFFSSNEIDKFVDDVDYVVNKSKKILNSNSSFLKSDYNKTYSSIPEKGRKRDELIEEALCYFDGQMIWNSENVSVNLYPPV